MEATTKSRNANHYVQKRPSLHFAALELSAFCLSLGRLEYDLQMIGGGTILTLTWKDTCRYKAYVDGHVLSEHLSDQSDLTS